MFEKIKSYMGKYKNYIIIAMFLCLVGVVFSVLPYLSVYKVITCVIAGEKLQWSFILQRVFFVIISLLLFGFIYPLGLDFSHVAAYNTLKNIRVSLQEKIANLPLGFLQEYGNGKIKKLFTDDIDQIELLLAHAIPEGVSNLFIALVLYIFMFIVNWRLALLSLASLPLGVFAMGMMFKAGMKKMNDYYAAGSKMNNTIIEYINGMEVVKVFGREGESFTKFSDDIKNYRDFTLAWYKDCWPWMAAYSALVPCVVLFTLPFGIPMVVNGTVSLQDLILIVCVSSAVGAPFLKALTFAGKFPQLGYKIDEINKALNYEPLKTGNEKLDGKDFSVDFKDVQFKYDQKEVLHNLSLNLLQGSLTALVGESGSGKSTLAKLLVHFYDLDSGIITLGGHDICSLSLEELNKNISYVSQEQFLFNTTIYENILFGRPNASREEVLDAAKKAQCEDFLMRLPNGIDSKTGDCGKMLSGGERQRISLARAILKNAPIVVLDEATAFIDPENEEKMNEALLQIIKGKTVLIIAHRLETIVNADKICVLKDGNIVGEDTHENLLKTCQEYQKLWKASEESSAWKIA